MLKDLYGVKIESFIDFREIMREKEPDSCVATIYFTVLATEDEWLVVLRDTIVSIAEEAPIIIYVDLIKKINVVK